ncbi:MAG: PAS domain S-box protein [Methanomicrobiales archaeon]
MRRDHGPSASFLYALAAVSVSGALVLGIPPAGKHPLILLAYVWALGLVVLGWILCARYLREVPGGDEYRKARLVLIGITLPVISAFSYLVADAAPWVLVFALPPITSLWYTLFVGYAIWKYGLFVITPETSAEAIISTMNDGLALLDDENRIVETNAALVSMLGRGHGELLGAPAETLFADPDGGAGDLSAVRSGDRVSDREIVLENHDGRSLFARLSASPVRGDAGTVLILRDISERKMQENALKESNRKLALLSSITRHDLLNQVMVLRGYLSFAAEDTDDPALLNRIARCETAARTIQQQVEFTRDYQALGQADPVWQKVRSVVVAQAALFRDHPVTIRADTAGAEVYADPLFSRVVYTLIDNALRHGGEVTAVTFSVRVEDGWVLSCEDDGVGIPGEEKEAIFRWGVGKNTGQGLFLAREILAITAIELHETGTPGAKARFDMRLPDGTIRFPDG